MSQPLVRYLVTVATPTGAYDVELQTALGPDAAARRAHWACVVARHGDVDEVTVTAVAAVCGWFAGCRHAATGTTAHPVLGSVPTCDRCAAFAG